MAEMKELKEKVENAKAQLHLSTQEYSTLKTQLDITKEILDMLDVLADFHANIKRAKSLLKSRHLRQAAETLMKTDALLQVHKKDYVKGSLNRGVPSLGGLLVWVGF